MAQSETLDYDGLASHKDKAESYTYNNANGDQTQKVAYGEVAGNDDGTFSDTGTDKFTTDFTYATSTTATLMSVVNHVTVSDQSASNVKETKYTYDNLAFGVVDKGNQTKEENWKVSTSFASSSRAFNSYGLVATSTAPRGKTTTYVYDAYNVYPATTTQPLSLVSQKTYNYATGKVDQTTDENGNKFLNTYDGLGRLTLVQQPDPSATTTLLTNTAYIYTDATGSVSIRQTTYLNSSTTVNAYTYYDGLKRTKQARRSAGADNFETKDLAYNSIGLLQQESLPYFSASSANTTATSTAALYTTYTYDALQRPLTSANVLGTTTKAYINWKTTVTDANGKEKAFTNDAYGNLIRVDEQNASATYTTTYTYNGLNGLTNITDASGNVRNFTYDGLGRRLTAQDLHASADATYGTWTYTYDDAGSLTQVVDPNSQTINRTYDDLNRVLTEDYTGQAGTEVKYTYDSCTQGLTRLCTASSSALSVTSTYNVLGQLTQESKTISGTSTSFITSYTYDRQGNQLIITNPDNSKVQYTYNIGGRPETIQRKEATDASYLDVVTDFDYSSTGKVSFQANANCTKTWNTYDPAKLYRLTNKLTVYDCTQSSGMMSMINPGDPGDASGLMKPAALSDEPAPETITTPAPSVEPAPSSTPAPSPAVEPTPGPSSSPPPVQLSLLDTASSKLAQTVLGWNSKVVIQSNGAKRSEIHIKQLNFKDVDGAFKPINATPVPAANGWEVTQNPFIARFPARSVGTAAMVNNNRFDTRTLTDINEPDLTMTITALGVSDVAGVLEYGDVGYGPEWYVRYPQAYPAEDADLIYLVWQGKVPRLQKLVRFNSALSADTDFSFQFAFPDKDPDFIRSTRVKWDKASKLTTNRAISVGKAGDRHGFSFKDFNIWDSNHAKRKVEAVTVDMERNAGGYTLTKHISAAFFAGATYPVFTDTTNTFYPDYDPETTSVDGLVYDNNPGSRSWASMRAATGDGAQPSVAFNNSPYIQTSPTTNLYVQLWRDVFLFDTSSIPDSDIITTATLSLYGDVAGNQLGSSVTIVQPNPTSNTDLVAGDFDVSTHWTMTQQNTADISYGSWVAGGYNTFALSATGLGNISKTGISNFGAVSNWDRDNTAPTWAASKDDYVGMYFADQAGTSQDPKLVVVSISGTPPIAPTNLLAEGQTSPTGVMDLTPEFSAIFNDPNTGDTSRLYQLQVSTSSTNWSSLMWDSGTSVMATTTQGTRSPDISYGGTALTYNGTTYYWRIKFWDQGLLEGLFSTSTASFTMYHNYAPTTSTSLLAEGQTNPTGVMSLTPKFSAIYIDPNTSDTASYYNVQVSASSANWSNLMWDSGTSVMATTTQGNRSPDITYAGSTLAWDGSTYYWRIKFWDTIGAEGAFSSTSAATFTMGTGGNVIQNISYTYDAVGNITKIVNSSPTNASSTITYVYDDLYRLTSANTAYTAPWIPGYSQSYTYDALGNMLSKTDIGTYLYATSTTPGYANPDAAISIAGGSINYDTNGNVISASSTTSSGWSVNGGIWNRRTPITIDHTKVSGSGTLANFPMLFSVTGTEFKTLANGGYVTSATGADIFFTSNDGVTKLNHELETYTATAGTVIAWVQIPLLKTSTDTVIYVYYGNASSVSQQASTAVWDSNYVGVYHLPDGTTLSATDSTAFANNGTSTNASALNGKIGGAAKFSGTTTSYISMANSSSLSITSAVTLSGWLYLNASTFANYTGLIRKGSTSNYYPNNYMVQGIAGTRLLQLVYAHSANNNDWINSSGSVAASGWTYVSAVIDTANNFRGIYLNGVLDTSSSVSAEAMTTSTDPVWLGKRHDAGLNGYLDEVRISKSARSADWIKTAYNNESTSTFFSLGTASSNVRTITPKTYYTWDYLNRLTRVVANSATSSYMYDPWGQRVRVAVATSTTATSYYPTKFYNMSRWVPTKHIFANGEDIATITGSGTAAVVSYIHPDHLAGANVLTDSNGSISELLDYLPYGSTRLDQQTGSAPSEQRKFIGEQYDPASQLSYLNARFYDGAKGKFLSQDPVFWEVGLTSDGKNAMANPQAMNSYSYANGNPIINKDPDGRCPICVPLVVAGGVGAIGGVGAQAFSDLLYGGFSQRTWQQNLTTYGVSAVGGATVGVGGVVAGVAAAAAGLSAAATAVTVGGTAGSLTIGTTVAGNRLLGQPTNPVGLAVTAALSALSAGLLKTLPEVPGRLPTFNSQAFYTGTHTLRQGAEEFLSNSLQSLGQTAVRVAAPAIQSFTSTFQGFVPKLRSSN